MTSEVLPPAVTIVNPLGRSPIVLTCEHASNFMPARYARLGLDRTDLDRHIAWDIGMAAVSRNLAERLDATLFLSGYSRLLIDCNRPIGVPSSIPEVSETTLIPGNHQLSVAERQERADQFYWPYQNALARHLDDRADTQRPTVLLSMHSFTPVFKNEARAMHVGVLFRRSARLGTFLVAQMSAPGIVVAANQPYQITDAGDVAVPVHGEARDLDVALLEIRQDLVADDSGVKQWSDRLEHAFRAVLAQDFVSVPKKSAH
jgi:predicted N-formylglutamate amidohydrolase